ncbi:MULTISPECIES: class I SAM-dependent methyltransferase [Arcobacteraceae]|uniref:class I SAM-dependent methyltransferase n=1 Tax=Arcobacteraceae TaxID=2808963 RepID=UPI000DE88B16|nr:class I SAM-dependent methyltransferase [Arcobacter sp. CECT 9188]RBQ26587.1 hypothetical protein CRU88_06805 [Arcobacter sp. CECT 9188]
MHKNELTYLTKKLNDCNSKLIIYGFNNIGYCIYQIFKDKVVDIVDRVKQGEIIDRISIKSIEDCEYNPNDIFVIASVNNNANKEIRKSIISKFGDKTKIYSINDYYFDENEDMARYCPICKTHSNYFKPFGINPRKDVQCPACGSLERHRLSWLVIEEKLKNINLRNKNLLHIAPEQIFKEKFAELFKENYVTADISGKGVYMQMDITDIKLPDNSFDYIYCSHVFEHIIDDREAMRELHRVLKSDGWAILLVPIVLKKSHTEEDFSIISKEDRLKHYGHPEHVRNYGSDYIDRLIESGWKVEVIYPEGFLTHKEIEFMGITKAAGEIYFCTK